MDTASETKYEPGELSLQVETNDAVFGEITEEGPNYRNVCTSQATFKLNVPYSFDDSLGGILRNRYSDDKKPTWSRSSLYSDCL